MQTVHPQSKDIMKAYLILAFALVAHTAMCMTARPDGANTNAAAGSAQTSAYRLDNRSGLYGILASPSLSMRSKMFHVKVALVKISDSLCESIAEYWYIFALGIFVIASGIYIQTEDRRRRPHAFAYRSYF